VRRFRPDVFGTSSYITGVNEAVRLCRAVKRIDPGVLTVVGGGPRVAGPRKISRTPSVDCIVRGDGTTVMAEIVRAREAGRPPGGGPPG